MTVDELDVELVIYGAAVAVLLAWTVAAFAFR